MQKDKKPKACENCKHPNCPKCGTTHGMWECIGNKQEVHDEQSK